MRQQMIFSQSGVFHLQQVANLVYRHTGQRHRLSSEQGISQLLQAATGLLTDPDVRIACRRLAQELGEPQLRQLSHSGIHLPGQDLVAEQAG